MTVRVLVVDDSQFYRHRLCEILDVGDNIKVVGTAGSGEQAIEQTLALNPDVITMDYEMPGMNGVSAIREIMKVHPTPVLMFSSLSYEGSRVSNDAMNAGAVGFLAKNFDKISSQDSAANKELMRTILRAGTDPNFKYANDSTRGDLSGRTPKARANAVPDLKDKSSRVSAKPKALESKDKRTSRDMNVSDYDLILVGCSTGGPVALKRILEPIKAGFSVPMIIVQHMPDTFTATFSARLNQISAVQVKEARDGDALEKGVVLVAPGGRDLIIDEGHSKKVRVNQGRGGSSYSPSVDVCFNSVAKSFRGRVLAIILTGMGSDGLSGVKSLKRNGATVWAQDEDSCVVYGMPMVVVEANLADQVLSLSDISARMAGHR